MNKDDLLWELEQWICPVWQEYISFRFIAAYVIGLFLILWLTQNIYAVVGWLIGYQVFGFIVAIKLGVFESNG